VRELIALTRGYPAFLRAACEAVAPGPGAALNPEALAAHPALQARLAEFWADHPDEEELRLSGLAGLPLLTASRTAAGPTPPFDTTRLTAKENQLLACFLAHPGQVCAKDDLIRAVWPEDKVFEQGVRDDSLAQLVRRLREKIEPEPAAPRYIHTVPGRGYRFTPG
jgi:DNA-binding response OmpR family regulator